MSSIYGAYACKYLLDRGNNTKGNFSLKTANLGFFWYSISGSIMLTAIYTRLEKKNVFFFFFFPFQNSDLKDTKALLGGTYISLPVSVRCKCFIWTSTAFLFSWVWELGLCHRKGTHMVYAWDSEQSFWLYQLSGAFLILTFVTATCAMKVLS